MSQDPASNVRPLFAREIGIPLDVEDDITNLCAKIQEWDGYTHPIEHYRAQVERAVWRMGVEAMRETFV